jgi:muramoyltetrapeptide carboxypeptidase
MNIIRPFELRKGDAIGIISPSGPISPGTRYRLRRGIDYLKGLGYTVKIGKNAMKVHEYSAGTIEERVQDIHEMFSDKTIKAIICTIGGYTSNSLLDYLEFKLIKRNPKIFIGYSDITALHCAIFSKTRLVTFYGPMVMPQLGEFPSPFSYTIENMMNILSSKPVRTLMASSEYTYEYLPWERIHSRRRKLIKNQGWKTLKEGKAEGRLIGGHLGTLEALTETEYFPDFRSSILFFEETESSTPVTERALTHLRQIGILDQIKGMIVGRTNPNEYRVISDNYDINKVIHETTKEYDFPIICDMDFGHTDPMLTLPVGIKVSIDATSKVVTIAKPAVQKRRCNI